MTLDILMKAGSAGAGDLDKAEFPWERMRWEVISNKARERPRIWGVEGLMGQEGSSLEVQQGLPTSSAVAMSFPESPFPQCECGRGEERAQLSLLSKQSPFPVIMQLSSAFLSHSCKN